MKKFLFCFILVLVVVFVVQVVLKIVDIMVFYIFVVIQIVNGCDIDVWIVSYIEFVNIVYEKSGVDLCLCLVYKQCLDWVDYLMVISINFDCFMCDLQVQCLCEQYGVDLVSLVNCLQNSGNGYIICGIGYMGLGEKNSGFFYGNVKDIVYNFIGVDCGFNIFVYEVGYNMGLCYFYEQDLEFSYYDLCYVYSGIYEWSCGYGVQGCFVIVMVYLYVFGINKQVLFFVNLCLVNVECVNQFCGCEEYVDVVCVLNSMVMQIVDFCLIKVFGMFNLGFGGDMLILLDLLWCVKVKFGGLFGDGEFVSMEGWCVWFGNVQLSLVNVVKGCCDNVLLVDVCGFDLLVCFIVFLCVGSGYWLSGKVMFKVVNICEIVCMVLFSECVDGVLVYNLVQSVELLVSGNEFSCLEKIFDYCFVVDQCNFYVVVWSDSGVSLLVDEMNLQEVQVVLLSVLLVLKCIVYDFESGIGGWSGVYVSVCVMCVVSVGWLVLEVYQWCYVGIGVSISLLGNLEVGWVYVFSVDVWVGDGCGLQVMIYVYFYLESQGWFGEYLFLGYKVVENGCWVSLCG